MGYSLQQRTFRTKKEAEKAKKSFKKKGYAVVKVKKLKSGRYKINKRWFRYVQPWHLKCRAGDILVSDSGYGFHIFHEILDNERIVMENLQRYGDEYEEEGQYILDTYCFNPEPWHYRFCRNYSEVVPEGELGDIHLSVAAGKIPGDVFKELRKRSFIIEEEDV